MQVTICDRCKEQKKVDERFARVTIEYRNPLSINRVIDLCTSCSCQLDRFIDERPARCAPDGDHDH